MSKAEKEPDAMLVTTTEAALEPALEPVLEEKENINEEIENLKSERKRLLEERSDMGRKIKQMQDDFGFLREEVFRLKTPVAKEVIDPELESELLDFNDPKQIANIARKAANMEIEKREKERVDKESEKISAQKNYEDKLYDELQKTYLKGDKEIEDELLSMKFTQSGDPIADAERFYNKAETAVLKRRIATLTSKKESPFKGTNTNMATGVGGSSNVSTREVRLPVISDEVQRLLVRLGKNIEKPEDRQWAVDALAKIK